MRNQIPFPRKHPFLIFQDEIAKALGITFNKTGERIEKDKLVVEASCANVEWAKSGGQTAEIPPKELVDAINEAAFAMTHPEYAWQVRNPCNDGFEILFESKETQNAIHQARFEALMQFILEENNAAWDQLAIATGQSAASYNVFKLADAKKIEEIAKRARTEVGPGGGGYKAALDRLEGQFRSNLVRSADEGKRISSRLLRSAINNLRLAKSAKIGETLMPNRLPSAGRAMLESVEGEAASLSKAGWIGATAYTGILLYQVSLAHEDAEKADEYEARLTRNLAILATGTIVGEASAYGLARLVGISNPYALVAIGVITGIFSTGLAEQLYGTLFAKIETKNKGPDGTE